MKNEANNQAKRTAPPNDTAENGAQRESLAERIRPFVLVFLLFALPVALYHAFTQYIYVYRIPAGTKVVNSTTIPQMSPLSKYIMNRSWYRKLNVYWSPYLAYRHIVIPDGATEIEAHAFSQEYTHSIQIPDSVTTLSEGAFIHLHKMKSISLPPGITEIPARLFYLCSGLTSIRIPDGVKRIGFEAFQGCSSLREVVIPDSVEYIDVHAFRDCTSLTSIRIPDGVKVICPSAFEGCTALRRVEISDSVEIIAWSAFRNCTGLEEILR